MMSPVTVANTHVEPIRKHMWSRFRKHVNFKTFVLIFIFSAFALRSIFVKPSQGMQATVSSHGPHFASMTHINERHDFGWFYTPMSKVVHQLENGTASMWDVLEISRYCVVASQIFAMLTERA